MMVRTAPPDLESAEQFFFDIPLYAPHTVTLEVLMSILSLEVVTKIDGYCPYCSKVSTFTVSRQLSSYNLEALLQRGAFDRTHLPCARDQDHKLVYYWRQHGDTLEKIGQYPSLATITNEQYASYRKHMSKEDGTEFYTAVGLSAHGVHIGAFLYLRRVFERLIKKRFDEFKGGEGWSDEEFRKLRMAEKVSLLKDHLPDFLVENASVYAILSRGIHTLTEEQCGGFFPIMRDSIVVILEDDIKKKQDLARRQNLALAIAAAKVNNVAFDEDPLGSE